MRILLHAWIVIATASCLDVPGTSEGGPCNAKGICSKGLVCEEGTCVSTTQVSWEKMRSPLAVTLQAVWGESESELFAVGSNGTILRYQGDGVDWTDASQNKDTPSTCAFYDVWGRSAINAWAVGSSCIYHFDGAIWKKESVPDPVKPTQQLSSYTVYGVHGSPEAGVWATGDGSSSELVLKYDEAGTWNVETAGLSYPGRDLVVSGKQVVVVGNAQHVRMHDGKAWVSKNLDGMTDLNAVFAAAPDRILAVGPPGMILRFDGASWTTDLSARLKYQANAIHGTGPDDFYIVGEGSGYSDEFRAIEHCAPQCSSMPAPIESKKVHGVWSSADGKTVVVVGELGLVYRRRRP
jgi:photosystem II stability/assembly factor-like uncharacterized protein